ncbi:MAG: Vitamin B12 dependent methionine synthase activation subunit, partial [Clostridiales bacterium]|nr:Vitamin B12 dependent methionine synthase activation subunit [Clostridiales bacterium]
MTTGTRREILRYLGTETPDARLSGIIADIAAELETNAPPKSVYRIFDCKTSSALTEIDGLAINSAGLARHMAGCRRAVLFAATLGAGADVLIRRYTVSGMEKAAVAQAVCAALLEEYCDKIMADMAGEPLLAGWYPRARFSPGYGDFDIAYQKDILRLLRGDVRIGLT